MPESYAGKINRKLLKNARQTFMEFLFQRRS